MIKVRYTKKDGSRKFRVHNVNIKNEDDIMNIVHFYQNEKGLEVREILKQTNPENWVSVFKR